MMNSLYKIYFLLSGKYHYSIADFFNDLNEFCSFEYDPIDVPYVYDLMIQKYSSDNKYLINIEDIRDMLEILKLVSEYKFEIERVDYSLDSLYEWIDKKNHRYIIDEKIMDPNINKIQKKGGLNLPKYYTNCERF